MTDETPNTEASNVTDEIELELTLGDTNASGDADASGDTDAFGDTEVATETNVEPAPADTESTVELATTVTSVEPAPEPKVRKSAGAPKGQATVTCHKGKAGVIADVIRSYCKAQKAAVEVTHKGEVVTVKGAVPSGLGALLGRYAYVIAVE